MPPFLTRKQFPRSKPASPSFPTAAVMDYLRSTSSAAATAASNLGLAGVLQLAWAAGTAPILLASFPIPGAAILHRLLLGFAARGKLVRSSTRKFTVPQRYFLHFYVMAAVLTTCLALSTWFYAYREMLPVATESLHYSTVASQLTGGSNMFSFDKSRLIPVTHKYRVWRTVFVLLLMDVQVLRRLHETLTVFNYSPSARMHIFGYLTGLFFYVAAPLSLANECILEVASYLCNQTAEFIVKGRERMPDLELHWWELLKPLINLGWCQWLGAAIFIWGWLHQLRCHAILGSLREHRGADEYAIPSGDWFEYVSCPHYFAEIVIYAGILFATEGSDITVWLVFIFVVSNLLFAAAETHRWYRRKFDNYPPSRRAVIPFIY